jgi:hypothetical protein
MGNKVIGSHSFVNSGIIGLDIGVGVGNEYVMNSNVLF